MESDGSDKKHARVTIFNQTYSLLASGETGEIEELARTVDELMTSIASRAGNLDSARIAVLACLHLADRLRTLERELADLRQRVDRKSKDFSVMLDQVINPD
jgi:cell division protein ZapA